MGLIEECFIPRKDFTVQPDIDLYDLRSEMEFVPSIRGKIYRFGKNDIDCNSGESVSGLIDIVYERNREE